MSLSAPTRRVAHRCLYCRSISLPIRLRGQSRSFTSTRRKGAAGDETNNDGGSRPNPVLEEYRRRNPEQPAQQGQQMPKAGDLGASSIFEDDRRAQIMAAREAGAEDDDGKIETGGQKRDPRNMLRVLDPDPNSRERWERKKVIQMVKRGGRLSKAQFIKRTEREHLVKSHNMKTSVKKLGMLARQIAGKNVDDAITQMRFSKKKVAAEILKQLEFARDEALVMRGMGLGGVEVEEGAKNLNQTSAAVSGTTTSEVEAKPTSKPTEIQLKDGKRHLVTDRTKMYIDQAWVGRGPYGKLPDYRAKGRVNVMHTPFTSISLLLKEEATRVREYDEREAKRTRQRLEKVWVPLPDRPIPMRRQWYSW